MSFSVAEKIRFSVDLSFVSLHFGQSKLCWVEELLLAKTSLNTVRSFFQPLDSCKESLIKAAGKFVLLSGQVLQFTVN